jgi:hypothetical protein
MTTTPTPSAVSGRERLAQIQSELAAVRKRINRATFFTALIGIALLGLLGVYFYIGYKAAKEIMVPENLVTLGQEYIDAYLPDAKARAEKEIIKASPGLADELSKQLYKSLPTYRTKLETFLIDQIDTNLKEATFVTDEEFRKFLRKHRSKMEESFRALAKSPKQAEKPLNEIVAALEEDLEVNLQDEAAEMLDTIKTANINWRAMAFNDKDLSEEAKKERLVWMLARRLYLTQMEPGKLIEERPVKAISPRLLATVKSTDAKKGTITVVMRQNKKDVQKTFEVEKGAKLGVSLDKLTEGTQVELYLSPRNARTVVVIAPRKTKEKGGGEK